MGDDSRRCPLERVTIYWCDSMLGIHHDGSQGTWNGERKRPEEYVRADIADALRARVAELEAELTTVRRERDDLREEVLVLRACVSCHLHGTGQELANAYARLRNFDKARDALDATKEGA